MLNGMWCHSSGVFQSRVCRLCAAYSLDFSQKGNPLLDIAGRLCADGRASGRGPANSARVFAL
jgi:hypothetical protein